MTIQVLRVRSGAEFHQFANLTQTIYQNDNNYIPMSPAELLAMFDRTRNFSLQHSRVECFLAVDNKQAVGRISAIIDYLYPEKDTGFFGCFESVNRPEVTEQLIKAASHWLTHNGRNRIIGPATLNTNQQVGLLVEGFHDNMQYMMPYNPPYYQQLLENCGLTKFTDLLSYKWNPEIGLPPKISRVAARATKMDGLVLRHLNFAQFPREVELVSTIFNQGMSNNWGYIPLSRAEVADMLNYCRYNADPELQFLAIVKGKPAGICLCFPTLPTTPANTVKATRVAELVVLPQFRFKGLEAVMMENCIKKFFEKGYQEADLSLVHEDNAAMTKILSRSVEAKVNRRFRVYQMTIGL